MGAGALEAWPAIQVVSRRGIVLAAIITGQSLDQCQVLRCDLLEQAGLLLLLGQHLLQQERVSLAHMPPCSTFSSIRAGWRNHHRPSLPLQADMSAVAIEFNDQSGDLVWLLHQLHLSLSG